jgi:predicted TIM-barrel fold metal-dependent hydrolase
MGEISNQYVGIGPEDERMEPWWALAEEMNIPVQIHMGGGPPGTISFSPAYRVGLGNPLLLEPVLARHPNLRISVQHMADGFSEEMMHRRHPVQQCHPLLRLR